MRVLIVEDEPRLADYIRTGLSEEAFIADVVGDGESGLARAQATTYDLIVLDLMLPDIDGMAVCRRLRAAGNPAGVAAKGLHAAPDHVLRRDPRADAARVGPIL